MYNSFSKTSAQAVVNGSMGRMHTSLSIQLSTLEQSLG
jgi:hypothetical protein